MLSREQHDRDVQLGMSHHLQPAKTEAAGGYLALRPCLQPRLPPYFQVERAAKAVYETLCSAISQALAFGMCEICFQA